MKRVLFFSALVILGCQEPAPVQLFTGNEITYELIQGSPDYAVNGTATLKERIDGFTQVQINLNGTSGEAMHPVHLHLGNISTPDAEIAAMLNHVVASSGLSVTLLRELADDTPIHYEELIQLSACIKIHLSESGPGRDVILAAGNIGAAYTNAISGGRVAGIAVCK
jgi:hypothetical protein